MPPPSFLSHFSDLSDPRVDRTKRHALLDILVIALLAVLCGAEGWEEIEEFGLAKQRWLKERLDLALVHGIPSDDTFRRVFARLDPQALSGCFRSFVQTLHEQTKGEVIALDGQVLRHSFDTAAGQPALHLVRAFATEARLVLGTVAVSDKSNEIPAVQALLPLLSLQGQIVTADAMHTQKETVALIQEQGGDYLLPLKENHPHLLEDVTACFAHLVQNPACLKEWTEAHAGRAVHRASENDYGHARQETRSALVLTLAENDPDWQDQQAQWVGLRSLVRIERTRQTQEKQSQETVFFLTNLTGPARQIARAARRHWQIENGLHWILDVQMNADACRIRKDNAPENLALLRSLAFNLLKQEKTRHGGVKARQKLAGWDTDYLLKLIA